MLTTNKLLLLDPATKYAYFPEGKPFEDEKHWGKNVSNNTTEVDETTDDTTKDLAKSVRPWWSSVAIN